MSDKAPTQRAVECVKQSTSGTFHRITNKEIELAQTMHEMWEDYTDDVNENAMRLAMYRDAAVREALEQAAERSCNLCRTNGACNHKNCTDRAAILGEDKKGAHNED
jgi:hypothetical protein